MTIETTWQIDGIQLGRNNGEPVSVADPLFKAVMAELRRRYGEECLSAASFDEAVEQAWSLWLVESLSGRLTSRVG